MNITNTGFGQERDPGEKAREIAKERHAKAVQEWYRLYDQHGSLGYYNRCEQHEHFENEDDPHCARCMREIRWRERDV